MLKGRGYYQKTKKLIEYYQQYVQFYSHLALKRGKKANLNLFERKVYSQNGEDGIIEYIFSKIKTTNKYFVEIGAGNGTENNSRYLKSKGWIGLQIDALKAPGIKAHYVTAENIESLLRKYKTPTTFDLLSIDIDGNDYWVWKAITSYHPRVVVVEYNASIPPHQSVTIPYNPQFSWDGSTFFGASLKALTKLAQSKGYQLVGTTTNGVNAFFVQQELVNNHFIQGSVETFYNAPRYNKSPDGTLTGHPHSNQMKKMVKV